MAKQIIVMRKLSRKRKSKKGAKIESLSEGPERIAMATQIIVKRKLSGKRKSK